MATRASSVVSSGRKAARAVGRSSTFKILSLDGGGIKGVFSAAILAELQRLLGEDSPLVDYFDMIVGTSTGGIIALGLATNRHPEKILQLYKDKGRHIFPPAATGFAGLVQRIFGPKYDSAGLRACVAESLGDRYLRELPYRVAIPAFNATTGHPIVFKSPYHSTLRGRRDLTLVDVALATSSAPTYFPAEKGVQGTLIDGGVWANCPVMVGIVEAIYRLKRSPKRIKVLSVGTTYSRFIVDSPLDEGGYLHWAKPISSLLMHAGRLGALEQAERLCNTLIRLDVQVEPDRFTLDDLRNIPELEQLGRSVAEHEFQRVAEHFFDGPAEKPKMFGTVGRRRNGQQTNGTLV